MEAFQHSSLPSSEYIRLVTIHPGRFDDAILLSFTTAIFQSAECPPYDALSYTWGTQIDPQTVSVASNDTIRTMNISHNLCDALVHLRHADKPRLMWIDAICIDQNNDAEKGPQVNRMGKVYRCASRVSVWLGKEADNSTRALNTMLWIGSKVSVDWVRLSVALRPECVEPSFQDVNDGIPLTAEDTEAIYHLVSRRWFERLWVRQEILISEANAVLQCGLYQIPWLPFRRALVCIYQKPGPSSPYAEKLNSKMLLLRGIMAQPSTVPLGYVRAVFGQSDCVDPRDRIYSLLEFLPAGDRVVVGRPDYTKSAETIFRDIVWRYVTHYASLDILSQCQIDSKLAGKSSWIPDWTKKELIFGRSYWRGFASSHFGAVCALSADGCGLGMLGVSIAEVKSLKDIPSMGKGQVHEQVQDALRLLIPGVELEKKYVTGVTMLEAYARTSVANALQEYEEPWLGEDPTLEEAQDIIMNAVTQRNKDEEASKVPQGHIREVYKIMRAMLSGRKLMHASNGYIGTVPQPTQEGDEICVLIGCHTPMVLRRIKDNTFRIVGECYVLGASEGEALLGPLPKETARHFVSDPKWGVHSVFVNNQTGMKDLIDPRLPSSLDLEDFRKQLAQNPGAKIHSNLKQLRKVFPKIEEFDII